MIQKHYCDYCFELLNNDFTYPTVRMKYESFMFCNEDCQNNFIDEITFDIYIDVNGIVTED